MNIEHADSHRPRVRTACRRVSGRRRRDAVGNSRGGSASRGAAAVDEFKARRQPGVYPAINSGCQRIVLVDLGKKPDADAYYAPQVGA